MARIRLEIPQQFIFQAKIAIRITDINYGGHVGNDSILSLMHEARMLFLQFGGYSELDINGASLIMGDVGIEFKKELFYGDQLMVSMVANDFTRIGFDIWYRFEKLTETNPVLVAIAKTGMICYNYKDKKVVAVPPGVQDQLGLPQ